MNKISANVARIFSESFSSAPHQYFSPGRINLIGEHIDYNDGFVLPAAINKGVYYAVAANKTNEIHLYAVDFDEWYSTSISEIKKLNGWKNYVLSVVNEFLLAGKPISGFDCVFGGDIPRGSGMSSSAGVEGGLAFALNDLFNCGLNRTELALLCQRAEHGFPNVQCGIMDQYANMLGKKDHVILLDCKNITHQYFPLQLKGYKIVLLNSNVQHSLATGEYNIRRKQCGKGLAILKAQYGIQSFREITTEDQVISCKELMDAAVFNRTLYVVQEIDRTKKAVILLQENNITALGKLMFDTHDGLSKLYEVSCNELDFLVQFAKENASVAGARLMGGGFGGCTINLVKEEGLTYFIAQTSKAYQNQFKLSLEPYIVDTADGTNLIEL